MTPHGDVEAPDAFLAPGVVPFIVSGKDGARLRASVEMDSPLVADLTPGVHARCRQGARDVADRRGALPRVFRQIRRLA